MRKLVRDRIPTIMDNQNNEYTILNLSGNEQQKYLRQKLVEESTEVLEAKTKSELVEELADVLEVMDAIIETNNVDIKEIRATKNKKAQERGRFKELVIIEF